MHTNLQRHAIGFQFDSECTAIPVYRLLQIPPTQGFRVRHQVAQDQLGSTITCSSQYPRLENQHHQPQAPPHIALLDPLMDCWAVTCQPLEKPTELKSENADVKASIEIMIGMRY